MEAPNLRIALLLASKIPLMAHTALMHLLQLSEPSPYVDLRSELIVAVLRAILVPSKLEPLSKVQGRTLKDPGVKGRIWVSTYTSPSPPETGARDVLMKAIVSLARTDPGKPEVDGAEHFVPELTGVEAEWTGYRKGVSDKEAPLKISEKEKYHEMMKEVSHSVTILYLHGGAYYLGDPASHRLVTKRLAKLTKGRCYSVRYRLAPKHPFPSGLLDAFVSYLTLLYPPPDAFHEPVKPENLVFAGDSAGGGLAHALLQLILEIRRENIRVPWHGEDREIPLPAGTACASPWLDVVQSSPPWDSPLPFDYLPTRDTVQNANIPPCEIWPASPPRKNVYAADDLMTHPLASPLLSESWAGAPPMYACAGWEMLSYENKFHVKRLVVDQGTKVVFDHFEAMPHCFGIVFAGQPISHLCFERWAAFILKVVDEPETIESKATFIKFKTQEMTPLKFEELSNVSFEEVRQRAADKLAKSPTVDLASVDIPSPRL